MYLANGARIIGNGWNRMENNLKWAAGMFTGALEHVTADVARMGVVFVNLYFVGTPGSEWVVVDTGLPGGSARIRRAAEERFGAGARPSAIVLTHGHFDHAGSALELATAWDAPIYAHPLELPYLTGRSDYPPQDPTMGGAIAVMSRFFPHGGYNFGDRVQPLPADGSVPGLPDWRWLHTPGHTHGHISLHRPTDRVLLAGDALATMDLDSWRAMVTYERALDRPAAPFTTDWGAARRSVERLAELEPLIIAAGHGLPIRGEEIPAMLQWFTERFAPPPTGRYVARPAQADAQGVVTVPPPVPDPLPARLAAAATGAAVGAALVTGRGRLR